ncbi:87d6ab7e-c330-4c59-9a62-b32f5dcff704 [Sclerotinia trifoliorum]|uniref:DNA 3'-5' helicase n=1 Tax=Sclerotinia trifoliorum TaxID=28548 RepID=A0A8H2VS50_9HELO|nr:87d6ab7e-c330-4c59-9a62-b32f5dcff704 [Sclerotinia trifoliorum]
MEKVWDPHLQRMMDNTSGDAADSENNHEDGRNQSFSTNFFASKDSQPLPPEAGFSFGPSPMRSRQNLSGLVHGQDNSARGPHDNVKFDRSSGYLMAPSFEPPASTGFTFGPAPRQFGQKMTPPIQNTNVPAPFNIPRHDSLPGYLSRPPFEPSQSMQTLHSYPTNSNGSSQGRLSLPSFSSHMQADSNSSREGKDSRVLTSGDNYFKQQILQDIELKTKPRNSQTYPSKSGTGQTSSPLTQLANNMISQTSMPLQRPVGPSPPGQNIFHMQAVRPQQSQFHNQHFTPPFSRAMNLDSFSRNPLERPNVSTNSSPQDLSSPSARVSSRRNSNRRLPSTNTREVQQGFGQITPHTPQHQISSSDRYALSSRASQVQGVNRSAEHSGFSPGQQTSSGSAGKLRNDRQTIAFGNAPPVAHGIQLVSPHELPDRFRQVFPYELFNAVQSKCFAPIYKTNNNIVVSAPTGSGKTALMELAICKLVESYGSGQFKIVYQAPIKSLCSERMKDWTKKFSHLNLPVAELTGDTSNAEMSRVGSASIIITTPEKWDSITRKWTDYQKLLQLVKLFLIDEVHILKDARGATLEAVVSRMHSIGANVRFVALSATVPNSHDIATWLGRDSCSRQLPAHRETFSEEFRPVKLQKHVHGYESRANDFAFEKILDGKIPALIQKYSCKKPIMVFCFTRKSCEGTAAILAEHWTRQRDVDRAWPAPNNRTVVGNKDLQELVGCGVAYHHAGLDSQDRSAIETAYLKGDISVICCTSTLAVGVNLPCQLVVLKGTVCFQDSGLVEYSDLEVMQMLGRGGRPQFDDSATAIIMTRADNADRYKKMISGQDVLESTLHLNLIEHLNSEIGLRTIKTAYEAKVWLGGTFLSVRMRQNPNYYKFSGIAPSRDADEQLELVCERDIKLLQDYKLVTKEEIFSCTEYGAAMSRYMVQFETMKLLLSIPRHSKTEQILSAICQAAEFKDLRMKPNERSSLREFNKSPMIKFPIKDNISTTAHKIFLMIQVQLGGIESLANNDFRIISRQFNMETNIILDRVQRLIRCVIDCKAFDCDSISTRFALDLSRSVAAGFWEHSSLQLRQVPQIGPASLRKLAGNNVNSVEKLAGLDTAGIERVMSKNPPFGKKMKDNLMDFPRLTLTAQILGRALSKAGGQPKVKVNAVLGYANDKVPNWLNRIPSLTFITEISSGTLVHFWRGNIKRLLNGNTQQFTVELSSPDDEIKCWLACDEIVGTLQSCVLNHDIPAAEFPPPKAVVEEQPIINNSRMEQLATSDEFDDGIDDDAMLAAAEQVEGGRRVSSDYGSDAFIDIDTIDLVSSDNNKRSREEVDQVEPVKMDNGKWACNHHCRDGNTLKNGLLCKHRCCREGLDKPRKVTRKKSTTSSTEDQGLKSGNKIKGAVTKPMNTQSSGSSKQLPKLAKKPRIMPSGASGPDQYDVEIIDLSETLPPIKYPDVAPKDYQKLHKLHTSIQKDISVRLPKNLPKFSYASGAMSNLSFMSKGASTFEKKNESDLFDSDEYEFPSPSTLLKGDMHMDKSISIPATQLPPPAMGVSRYERKDQQDSSEDLFDDSTDSLEAAMIGLDDSMNLRPATPKLNTSFANNVFDFAAFDSEEAYAQQFSSPLMNQVQKRNTQEEEEVDNDDMDIVMQSTKRQQSSPWMKGFHSGNMMSYDHENGDKHSYDDSPALPQMKRRRVDDGDDESGDGGVQSTMKSLEDMKSTSGSSAPVWGNEMESDIIDDEENEGNKKREKQKFGIKVNDRPEPAWVGEMDPDFIKGR